MPKPAVERRYLAQPVELRASTNGGPGVLFGYAAKYNTLSQNLGGFVETIAPGFFDKSIADAVRVMCRYNHDDSALLGTTDAGTLVLSLDDIGLMYEDDLPDTTTGRDVGVLAARGDVRYSSFAFRCIEDEWDVTPQGFPLRRLIAGQLVDVAPVNSPAYFDTTTAKRSLEAFMANPEKRALSDDATEKLTNLLGTFAQADAALDPVADAIKGADLALDAGLATLASILGVPNPDSDAPTEQPDNGTILEMDSAPDDDEQRDTHSLIAVRRRLLELDALK